MNYEDLGELLDREALGTLPTRGTLGAGRLLFPIHDLLLREELKALGESNLPCSGGDGEGEVPERIKSHGAVTAGGAFERALQLTHEEVYNL
jgi:hypothetical protein